MGTPVRLCVARDEPHAELLVALLRDSGISARAVGQNLAASVGDLPADAVRPEVWVDAAVLEAARRVVAEYREVSHPAECPTCGYDLRGLPQPRCPECGTGFNPPPPAWTCPACGERIAGQFTECWRCAQA